MLRSRKHADEPPENQLEPALRVLWRKNRDRRLFSDDELQFRNEVDDKQGVRAERLLKGVAPDAQLCFALAQKRTDQALKRLRQRGIRNVALVLVELARGKKPARRNEQLMQLIDHGGFTDTGVSGDEHQLRPRRSATTRSKAGEQDLDLTCSPVEFLGNQQPVRRVMLAERKFVDAALESPNRQGSAEGHSRRRPRSGSAPRPSWRAAS